MRDVTGVNLAKLAAAAYDLSRPQGLGMLHFVPGSLTDEKAASLVKSTGRIALSLDYVKGRAVKLTVFRADDGTLTVSDRWFDHSSSQDAELWRRVDVQPKPMNQ